MKEPSTPRTLMLLSMMRVTPGKHLDYKRGYECHMCKEALQASPKAVRRIMDALSDTEVIILCNPCTFELTDRLRRAPGHTFEFLSDNLPDLRSIDEAKAEFLRRHAAKS